MGLLGCVGRILKSPMTYHKANKIFKSAKGRYSQAEYKLEQSRDQFQRVMKRLGKKKLDFAANLLTEVEEKLLMVRGQVNFTENKIAQEEQLNFEENTLPVLKKVSMSAGEIVNTGLSMTGAGTATFAGAIGLVGAFGTASTGTAIASLSGAAASNATLAFFGGGSIAAGGAGMTTGAVVLGGIALAPVLIIGAFKFTSYAEKKLTAAEEFSAQVDVAVEQINAMIESITQIEKHFIQFESILDMVATRLKQSLNTLMSRYAKGGNSGLTERSFFACVLLTKTLKRILEVNLMTSEGLIADDSIKVIEHARYMNNENSENNEVVDGVLSGMEIIKPQNVENVSEISPGKDSIKYFWLYDMEEPFCWKGCLVAVFIILFFIQLIRSIFF